MTLEEMKTEYNKLHRLYLMYSIEIYEEFPSFDEWVTINFPKQEKI